jgi:hypothetical protein
VLCMMATLSLSLSLFFFPLLKFEQWSFCIACELILNLLTFSEEWQCPKRLTDPLYLFKYCLPWGSNASYLQWNVQYICTIHFPTVTLFEVIV